MSVRERMRNAVNAFANPRNTEDRAQTFTREISFGGRPDRSRLRVTNDRSIMASIYTRLAIDVAAVAIRHVKVDENEQYKEQMKSELNNCFMWEANIDQAPTQFFQDIALSLFDKGAVAVVPIDTDKDPNAGATFDIYSMRVGEIVAWYPRHVRVSLWNEDTGRRQEIVVPKRTTAIIENPMYQVMNESNGTLQRLMRKLGQIDALDENAAAGKLDMIIQLPYVVKTDTKRGEVEKRRQDIERQMRDSQYGIAYTDGTEKITQLNRPAENNMLKHVEMLTEQLYAQLGLTETVFNGTADEATMTNYNNRSIEPVLRAITEAMTRAWITKTGRTQGQRIIYLMDPFRLVPVSAVAEIGDKMIRNQILSPNEMRAIIGYRPVNTPEANALNNPNVPGSGGAPVEGETDDSATEGAEGEEGTGGGYESESDALFQSMIDELEAKINELVGDGGESEEDEDEVEE